MPKLRKKKLIRQRCKEKLLGIDGLPVIIINLSRNSHATSFVMLIESDKNKEAFISGVKGNLRSKNKLSSNERA